MSTIWQILYNKAPRWVRATDFRGYFVRIAKNSRDTLAFASATYFCFVFPFDPYPYRLARLKPATDEERLKLKALYRSNGLDRKFEIDEYPHDTQPLYDTYERRRQYPQYYGDKYNHHKKYNPIC